MSGRSQKVLADVCVVESLLAPSPIILGLTAKGGGGVERQHLASLKLLKESGQDFVDLHRKKARQSRHLQGYE